jgi:hypothetical protein
MTTNKLKVLFVGFHTDYNQMEIDIVENASNMKVSYLFLISCNILRRNKNLVFNFIRTLLARVFFVYLRVFHAPYVDMIIFSEHNDPFILSRCSKLNVKKCVLFRNLVSSELAYVTKLYNCYTFDLEDSVKYKMALYRQFCSGYEYIKRNKFNHDNDFVFLGRDKGRKNSLNALRKKLECYKVKIIIPNEPASVLGTLMSYVGMTKKSKLSYKEYLNLQLNTHIVIDFVQDKQSGLTMRTIEAIRASKKVLTNNPHVLSEPIYATGNVFYFTQDTSSKELEEFYKRPFSHIDETLICAYSPAKIISEIVNS